MDPLNVDDLFNVIVLGREPAAARNIRRTITQGVLKIEFETQNNDCARIGFAVGGVAGFELGPGALVTGYIGAKVGSMFDQCTTHTRYYDVATNAFLGNRRNEAARRCNENGLNDLHHGNFNNARDWFNKAYHTCANGYREEGQFRNNRDVAEIAARAQRLMRDREYASAVSEFQRAYDLSCDVDIRYLINHNINIVKQQQNEAASQSHQRGMELFQRWNFTEAERCFHSAFLSCSNDYHSRSMFSDSRFVAELLSEAQGFLNRNNYAEAISKCLEAYDLNEDMQDVIDRFVCHIKNQQNEAAFSLNQQGVLSFNEGNFGSALQNFQEAYDSCTLDCALRNKYSNNKSVADLILEGQLMFDRGDYATAVSRFQEAYREKEDLNGNAIIEYINDVKNVQNGIAANFYCQGLKALKEDALIEASLSFEEAYNSCANDCTSKSKYLNARNSMNIAAEAQAMSNRKEFDAAIIKFNIANELSHVTEIKHSISVYIGNTIDAKAEVAWKKGKVEWDNAWAAEKDNNVQEANFKFQKANSYFNEALNIKHKAVYQNWKKASCMKMEGDKLFNEGIESFDKSQLQVALSKLKEAQTKFQEGFEASQDVEFSECMKIVRESIQCIENKCKEIDEADEIQTALRAGVADISVTPSHAQVDEESQLEELSCIIKNNDLYFSRQV